MISPGSSGRSGLQILPFRRRQRRPWVRWAPLQWTSSICALKRKNKNVRLGAIGALAIIRDPRSVAPLTETLRDENLEVRWQAAIALGEIGDERAIGALQAVLRDTDKYVRYGAAFALAKLGWKPETAEERAFFFIGMQEWKAAEAVGPAAIPALSHVLTDHDRAMRRKVIEILGSIGDDRAIRLLCRGLPTAAARSGMAGSARGT